jgi:hypothetical protein
MGIEPTSEGTRVAIFFASTTVIPLPTALVFFILLLCRDAATTKITSLLCPKTNVGRYGLDGALLFLFMILINEALELQFNLMVGPNKRQDTEKCALNTSEIPSLDYLLCVCSPAVPRKQPRRSP